MADTAFTAPGHWYKGNLHMHSTESDGAVSPEEAARWYRERGYDFISLTDHRKTSDASPYQQEDFLIIPGMELDCVDPERNVGYHIVGIGINPFSQEESSRSGPAQKLIDAIRAHGGEAIMAHPYWLGQDAVDIAVTDGYVGVEAFNATCDRMGKPFGNVQWDGLLDRGIRTWGFAVDDTHRYEVDAGKGWIMVKAPELSQEAVLHAIRSGAFYATQGPTIIDARRDGDQVRVHTSPVKNILFISNRGRGVNVAAKSGEWLTTATCPARTEGYVRIECIDECGRRAWTQPIVWNAS